MGKATDVIRDGGLQRKSRRPGRGAAILLGRSFPEIEPSYSAGCAASSPWPCSGCGAAGAMWAYRAKANSIAATPK